MIKTLNREIQAYKDLLYVLVKDNKKQIQAWVETRLKEVMGLNEEVERTTDIETFFKHLLQQ